MAAGDAENVFLGKEPLSRGTIAMLLVNALRQSNVSIDDDECLTSESDYPIFGPDSNLSSMTILNFVVSFEKVIGQQYGHEIELFPEDVIFSTDKPLTSMRSFVDHVFMFLQDGCKVAND